MADEKDDAVPATKLPRDGGDGVGGDALGNRPSAAPGGLEGLGSGGTDLGNAGGTGGGTGGGGGLTAMGTLATGGGTDLGGGNDSGAASDIAEMAEKIQKRVRQDER